MTVGQEGHSFADPTVQRVQDITGSAFSGNGGGVSRDYFCLIEEGGRCVQCVFRYYYSSKLGQCVPVQNECSSFDSTTGECWECFSGYQLLKGICLRI